MDQGLPGEEVGEEGLRPAVLVGAVGGEAVHGAEGVHQGGTEAVPPVEPEEGHLGEDPLPEAQVGEEGALGLNGLLVKEGLLPLPAP